MQSEFDQEDEKRRQNIENNSDYFDVLKQHRDGIELFLNKNFTGAHMGSIKEVQPNPYAQPGQPLYNRFVSQWERVADQKVELVFHGTGTLQPHTPKRVHHQCRHLQWLCTLSFILYFSFSLYMNT